VYFVIRNKQIRQKHSAQNVSQKQKKIHLDANSSNVKLDAF